MVADEANDTFEKLGCCRCIGARCVKSNRRLPWDSPASLERRSGKGTFEQQARLAKPNNPSAVSGSKNATRVVLARDAFDPHRPSPASTMSGVIGALGVCDIGPYIVRNGRDKIALESELVGSGALTTGSGWLGCR